MKKICVFLIAAVLLSMCNPIAFGDGIVVVVNGVEAGSADAVPFLDENNRTMVPIRFVAEALKADVSWETDGEQTVTIQKDSKILFVVGSRRAAIDGRAVEMDTAPVLRQDRVFVPVRYAAEYLGARVEWDQAASAVYITTEDAVLPQSNTSRPLNVNTDPNAEEVNVLDFGADPTGVKDSTSDIKRAHNTGKRVYYPNGTYLFNGATLELSGGVRFESPNGVVVHNSISDEPILNFDDFGNLVGLQQGHLERYTVNSSEPISDGTLVSPPLSQANYNTRVDFLPIFYNDFGLEYTRQATGNTWRGWYYWTWNYHNAGEGSTDPTKIYDPERHPLLGYYKGDDPVVLDWICYWMKEYGINGTILYTSNYTDWENPASLGHWMWQLFNNVPNFQKLKYVITMAPTGYPPADRQGTDEVRNEVREQWRSMLEQTYFTYSDNVYTVDVEGRKCAAIFVHEELALAGWLDKYQTGEGVANLYKETAGWLKEHGYDGLVVMARHYDQLLDPYNEDLKENGIYRYHATYEGKNYPALDEATEDEVLATFREYNTYKQDQIFGVFTAHHTHSPHPSGWNNPDYSPEIFETSISNAIDWQQKLGLPAILTCYNVSEWGEGGPGLIPNMKNRFAWLQAVKNAVVIEDEGGMEE